MEGFKQFIIRHFEAILVRVILIAAYLGMYLIDEKSIVLNSLLIFLYSQRVTSWDAAWGYSRLSSPSRSVVVNVSAFPDSFFKGGQDSLQVLRNFCPGADSSSWQALRWEHCTNRMNDVSRTSGAPISEYWKSFQSISNRPIATRKAIRSGFRNSAMEIGIAMELPRTQVENVRVAWAAPRYRGNQISGEILLKAADLSSGKGDDGHTHRKGAYLLTSWGPCSKRSFRLLSLIINIL